VALGPGSAIMLLDEIRQFNNPARHKRLARSPSAARRMAEGRMGVLAGVVAAGEWVLALRGRSD